MTSQTTCSQKSRVRTLGIDPGLDRTGWAVLETDARSNPFFVRAGLIHTSPRDPLPRRLEILHSEISAVVAGHKPQAVAIEAMFFTKRAATVAATIQARGVILLAAQQAGLEIASYDPRRVKITLTGSGAAQKPQMQRMVQLLLRMEFPLSPDDVADAAAIALCHCKTAPYQKLVRAASAAEAAA
ncbi:MAG: crossover junction endodeoxyribonuclease RuvC [Elusimicrobiales bacterium]